MYSCAACWMRYDYRLINVFGPWFYEFLCISPVAVLKRARYCYEVRINGSFVEGRRNADAVLFWRHP